MDHTAAGRRYGGKTTEERRAERRERLLDAGLELFGTRGYAATTIETLCSTTRLNPRYFYEQFPSREALLVAVYERHVQAVLNEVAGALEHAPPDPRGRLEAGLRAFVEATLQDERAARVNYFEMVGVSREREEQRRDILRAYADVIAVEIDASGGQLPAAVDPRQAAVALVGATDGLVIDWLSGDRRAPQDTIVATLLEIFAPRPR
jgi:AcrR family transcriptional regulator